MEERPLHSARLPRPGPGRGLHLGGYFSISLSPKPDSIVFDVALQVLQELPALLISRSMLKLEFEWHDAKAEANWRDHGVSFELANSIQRSVCY
jgi:hypothetical protein